MDFYAILDRYPNAWGELFGNERTKDGELFWTQKKQMQEWAYRTHYLYQHFDEVGLHVLISWDEDGFGWVVARVRGDEWQQDFCDGQVSTRQVAELDAFHKAFEIRERELFTDRIALKNSSAGKGK